MLLFEITKAITIFAETVGGMSYFHKNCGLSAFDATDTMNILTIED